MTASRSQPSNEQKLRERAGQPGRFGYSPELQMLVEAADEIAALKARVAELEGALRSAASYMPGRMEGSDCSSCKATEIVESALSHAGPVARDGER